ncbi:hypothetical protein [Acinetobacter sp. NIPH 2100]|uniref:hypothetical protein n=1 Tax=Acinetobacter sp. NIPH 2100 TaxID=1217708 RepID=UPI0002D000D1|nr:hypothetical protein [Acinetobacter sp. NIPH 2100]ENX42580.1 hypothetical protein F887_00743 [Acinetobacter sp. NIPH 2100]
MEFNWQTIISLLSITVISTSLIQVFKYMALPHYRLEINRKQHSDKANALSNYINDTYAPYKDSSNTTPKSVIQRQTNAAFATTKFNFELIFLLLDRDVRDIELRAADIQSRWILLNVDYKSKKIKCLLKKTWLPKIIFIVFILYFVFSILIIGIVSGYEWYGLRGINESYLLITLFLLILIDAYIIYVMGIIKNLENLIDWED